MEKKREEEKMQAEQVRIFNRRTELTREWGEKRQEKNRQRRKAEEAKVSERRLIVYWKDTNRFRPDTIVHSNGLLEKKIRTPKKKQKIKHKSNQKQNKKEAAELR